MASLNIPDYIKASLEKIGTLSESEFKKLDSAIASLSPSLDPAIEDGDNSELIRTIVNLIIARGDIAIQQFSNDVLAGLERNGGLPKKFSRDTFLKRLEKLLGYDSLALSARGIDVQQENDAVFVSSRVISDIRPIFNTAGTKAVAALIVHNIKITYHQNNEHKELFISLDNADLSSLRKVIDRAEKKTGELEIVIKKTGLKQLKARQK